MEHGLHDSKVEPEEKVQKRKVVDLGPDHARRRALRAVLALPPLRERRHGHEQLRVREPRRPHADRDLRGPAHHAQLRGQPGRRLPGGRAALPRLPLQDAGLVPGGDATRSAPAAPPAATSSSTTATARCTACGPRRNVEVNKSWMCDIGRARVQGDRARHARRPARAACGAAAAWEGRRASPPPWTLVAERLRRPAPRGRVRGHAPGHQRGPVRLPHARRHRWAACSTSASAIPQDRVQVREDNVLLRADRNPNTQGCLDQGLGRTGVDAILGGLRARARSRRWSCRARSCCGCRRPPTRWPRCRSSPSWPRTSGPELDARPRRAARRGVGGGGRHLHQLPAPRAAHPAARSPPPGDAAAPLGAGGGRCSGAWAAPRRDLGARGRSSLLARGRARLRRPRPTGAVGADRPRARLPGAEPRRPAPRKRRA